MEIIQARNIALDFMSQHLNGLGWSLNFNNRKSALGFCDYNLRRISLSRHFVESADKPALNITLAHEVAHAVVGPGHHHNSVWRRKCIELGGNGSRTGNMVVNDWLYMGNCKCGHQFKAHRLGKMLKNGVHRPGCGSPVMWRNTRTGEISLLGTPVLDPANVVW